MEHPHLHGHRELLGTICPWREALQDQELDAKGQQVREVKALI